ncbi:MAG TPA: Ku protein [Flavisolibacter sp.]|nr:Ku protein [Flavisolibacter sp.]
MKGARAIWSGNVSFGLINFPVKLQSAAQDDNLDFDLLSKGDLAPIHYARIDSKTGEEIAYKDIVKGYQYAKGKYIVVTDEDFEKARPHLAKSIDIIQFVKEEEIDPLYYEKPYYIVPSKGAEKSYKLLVKALDETKTVGIAEFMLRNRAHLCALKSYEGVLLLNQLRYAEEIRSLPDAKTASARITPKEIQLATKLIHQLTETFNPAAFKDTYVAELKKVIRAKAEGKNIHIAEPRKIPSDVRDLMEVLKESLSKGKKRA